MTSSTDHSLLQNRSRVTFREACSRLVLFDVPLALPIIDLSNTHPKPRNNRRATVRCDDSLAALE